MPVPILRVNTLVTKKENPCVDPISKMFIVFETIMGFDRLPLIGKGKFIHVFLTFVIHLIWSFVIMYACLVDDEPLTIITLNKIAQSSTCAILSFTRCNCILSYYFKLNTFDAITACKVKVSSRCIHNAVITGVTNLFIATMFIIYSSLTDTQVNMSLQYLPLNIVYSLEVHYCGHLISLLIPRLKLINYYIESSLSGSKLKRHPILKEFVYVKHCNARPGKCNMDKLMDAYEIVVQAFDCLIEGIKWQLIVSIITGFTSTLGFLYVFWLDAMRTGQFPAQNVLLHIGMTSVLLMPLFSPCTFAHSVQTEVKNLRELISSKLYENKLEKSERSTARALLAYSDTRDLSFRLLSVLSIDISLPFKYIALLFTYLIILLQFEKVVL